MKGSTKLWITLLIGIAIGIYIDGYFYHYGFGLIPYETIHANNIYENKTDKYEPIVLHSAHESSAWDYYEFGFGRGVEWERGNTRPLGTRDLSVDPQTSFKWLYNNDNNYCKKYYFD